MTVFLRPQPASTPVSYLKSLEGAGLVVMPQKYLAIYTCGKQGAQGPAGGDQNSWYDTIIAAASDELSSIVIGGPKTTFRSPYPLDLTLGYIRISLTNAPTGADFIVDIKMNGVTMFSTLIRVDAGDLTSVGSGTPAVLSTTYIPDDAKLEVYVIQVGSTLTGTGLKVAITGIKAA